MNIEVHILDSKGTLIERHAISPGEFTLPGVASYKIRQDPDQVWVQLSQSQTNKEIKTINWGSVYEGERGWIVKGPQWSAMIAADPKEKTVRSVPLCSPLALTGK